MYTQIMISQKGKIILFITYWILLNTVIYIHSTFSNYTINARRSFKNYIYETSMLIKHLISRLISFPFITFYRLNIILLHQAHSSIFKKSYYIHERKNTSLYYVSDTIEYIHNTLSNYTINARRSFKNYTKRQ